MAIRAKKIFPGLALKLALLGAAGVIVRMDAEQQQIEQHEARINEMLSKVATLESDNETIFAAADEKGVELSAEDQKTVDDNLSEIKGLHGDIDRRQEQVKLLRKRTTAAARLSEAEPSDDAGADEDDDLAAVPTQRARQASGRTDPRALSQRRTTETRIQTVRENRDLLGFKCAAHYLEDVKQAANGYMSSELRNAQLQMGRRMDANVTFGEDGAFAVPPDVANYIKKKIDASAELVGLWVLWTTSSESYTWFLDEQEPWTNTNGITGQWLDEGQTMNPSSPKLSKIKTELHKYAVAVPATSEILRSASQMEQLIRVSTPAHIAEALNGVILRGNGVGKPDGIFNSGVLAVFAKDAGQTAATVTRTNVVGVHNRVHPSCRNNPAFRWIANLDVEMQLENMVGADQRSLYLPGTNPNLADKPYDTLRGRPLIYSPHASALGEVGDLAGIDFSKYLIVMGENMRADFSIHVRFMSDEGVFRFIIHVGGRPKWGKKIIEPNSVVERSFAAAIAQRA